MKISWKNKEKLVLDKKIWLYILFVLTPLIAGILIGLISGAGIFSLDAWNTIWSDERGYYRAILIMRTQGLPSGVQSYNEVASVYPAWGAYNFVTYLPYLLLSFITGITSHNFIYYCNVIIGILTNLIVLIVLKPSKKNTMWLIGFSCTFLIYQRYVWSGMSEAASVFMLLVTLACAIRLFEEQTDKKTERILLTVVILLSLLFGMVRPFLFAVLLVPMVYILQSDYSKGKKAVSLFLIVLGTVLALVGYVVLRKGCAVYFSDATTMDTLGRYISLLKSGEIKEFIVSVLYSNYQAHQTVLSQALNMVGFVTFLYALTTLILVYVLWRAESRKERLLIGIYILIGIMIFEATIVLYSPAQLHRMLLGIVMVNCYLICLKGHTKLKLLQQAAVIVILILAIDNRPDFFMLPQEKDVVDEATVKEDYQKLMPYDAEDAWSNTIAHLPEAGNLYLGFCFPAYMNTSSCKEDYLLKNIAEDSLKSKYVYLPEGNFLNDLCAQKYELIWNEYGYCIYKREEGK